jgi:hypothetical protein
MNSLGDKVVFIMSETRSGSTWLSYVLGSYEESVHLGEFYRPFVIPGHVACRLCEAKEKKSCDYLNGIENVDRDEAFDFAFKRFNKSILIDCSKDFSWLDFFIKKGEFSISVVHVLRDPRGWYASEKRRNENLDISTAMDRWVQTNSRISSYRNNSNVSYVDVIYDEVLMDAERYFPEVIRTSLGLEYNPATLEYWNKEHHGLGGNGAALNNLYRFSGAKFNTSDDDYYVKMRNKVFYDSRWKSELSNDEVDVITSNEYVNEQLDYHGCGFAKLDDLYRHYSGE